MFIKNWINRLLNKLGYQVINLKYLAALTDASHKDININLSPVVSQNRAYTEEFNTITDSALNPFPVGYDHFSNLVKAYEYLFNQVYQKSIKIGDSTRLVLLSRMFGTPTPEAFFLIKAINDTENIFGDVCEFGVAQGATSALLANEIKNSGKTLHLFDSFKGLSEPTEQDELINDMFNLQNMKAYKGTMSYSEELVLSRLRAVQFPQNKYIIHKGFIQDILKNSPSLPNKVSFAYVDFDLYEPIKYTLDYLDKVMPIFGVIIVDDYNYFSSGVKKAVDEFCSRTDSKAKYSLNIPDECFGYFAIIRKEA